MSNRYAIVGPDNKAINFIAWDGVTEYDYGAADGNYLVTLDDTMAYGIGWLYDAATNTFIDPNPVPPDGE